MTDRCYSTHGPERPGAVTPDTLEDKPAEIPAAQPPQGRAESACGVDSAILEDRLQRGLHRRMANHVRRREHGPTGRRRERRDELHIARGILSPSELCECEIRSQALNVTE